MRGFQSLLGGQEMRHTLTHHSLTSRNAAGYGVALCYGKRWSSVDSSSASSHLSPPALSSTYKSTHRGSGAVPLPDAGVLKPRRAGAAAAEAALFGSRSSCAEDQGSVPPRRLSPLQRRQLMMQNKAAFVLTPQALRRVKYLLAQYASKHTPKMRADAADPTPETPGADASTSEGSTSGGVTPAASVSDVTLPTGIRIGVRRRGCSGFSYTVNYYFPVPASASVVPPTQAKRVSDRTQDVVVEQDGVQVVVDGDALFYVIGTEMDYTVRNVEEKFTFRNPNQKYSCGCEESFMPFGSDDLE